MFEIEIPIRILKLISKGELEIKNSYFQVSDFQFVKKYTNLCNFLLL